MVLVPGCSLSQPSARLDPTPSGKLRYPWEAALPFQDHPEFPSSPALRLQALPPYLCIFVLVKWFGRRIS